MSAIYDIAGTSNDTFMINGKATFIQGAINPENYQGLDGDLYLQSGVEGDPSQVATVWIKKDGRWVDMANNALPVSSSENKDKFLISLGNGNYGFAELKYEDGAIETVVPAGSEGNALYATMATNDQFRIRVGGEADSGWIEFATADNGREPIYVRQYTGNLKGSPEVKNELILLDENGYTILSKHPAASNSKESLQAPTIGWINDPTKSTNIVHRDGNETLSGTKTFTNTIQRTASFSGSGSEIFRITDSNGKGYVNQVAYYTNNKIFNRLNTINNASGKEGYLEIQQANNGEFYATVGGNGTNLSMTKATSSTSDITIPTMGWVNNPATSTNVVHRTGNETINGVKTFTEIIQGTALKTFWADLAEYYEADNDYPKGTLMTFGGDKEVTIATEDCNAVVSSNPALIMNGNESFEHPCPIALVGRVPVRVIGKVKKFDLLEISEIPGVARALSSLDDFNFSNVIARALESNDSEEEKLVLCVVKFEL